MAWSWRADASPRRDAGLEKCFGTQGEAETWLGEFYPDLVEAGVTAVTLYEEERVVYGPMSLSPAP